MVSSAASSVDRYLRELPIDRRRELEAVRRVVRENLPSGYIETMDFGMICYAIPLARFAATYNGKPICYAGLAAQKRHNALYLVSPYMDPAQERQLRDGATREGKSLDMGKSCVRFARADQLPLSTIGKLIAQNSVDRMIAMHDEVHGGKRASARKTVAKRAGAAKTKKRTAAKPAKRVATKRAGAKPVAKRTAAKRPAAKRVVAKRAPARKVTVASRSGAGARSARAAALARARRRSR